MNHFQEYQNLQMIIRTFEGYHEDFIRISFSRHAPGNFGREKEANTTSRTAHAVCIQNSGMLCVCFSFENQICQGSSF